MRGRVVAVDPAAEHGDGRPVRLERAAVRLAVHAARQPADDDEPAAARSRPSMRATCAPYGEHARAPTIATAGRASSVRVVRPAEVEPTRRIVDRTQQRRELVSAEGRHVAEIRRRAIGERLGDVLRLDVAPPRRARRSCARRAATFARPRPERRSRSTARVSSSSAAAVRDGGASASRSARGDDARAHRVGCLARRGLQLARTRPRHGHDDVETVEQRARQPVAVARDALRASTSTARRDRRARRTGRGSSCRRAESAPGSATLPAARATRISPSSSGCRNASSAGRWNSASSSSSSTPRCARLASPGREPRTATDDRRGRRAVMRRAERRVADQRMLRDRRARRRSGSASPRAPPRPRAAAGCPAVAAPASSCRSRAARRGACCDGRRRRARARAAPAPGRGRRRGRAAAAARLPFPATNSRRLASRRAGTRPPRRGGGRRPARRRRAPPRRHASYAQTISLEPGAARALGDAEHAADAPQPPVERELAARRVLGEPLARDLPATRRAARARSAGRSPSPPSSAPPAPG